MYVYADVVLVLNFIMNSMILMLTAWTASINYRWWRLLLAAAAGSVYALFEALPEWELFYTPLAKLLVSLALVSLAFRWQTRRTFILLVALFYIISFLLGGAVIGWFLFAQSNAHVGAEFELAPLSGTQVVAGGLLGMLLILLVGQRIVARLQRKRTLYTVRVEFAGRIIEVTAMLDTGNGLYTITGRKPVVLVNNMKLLPLFSKEVIQFLACHQHQGWLTKLDECQDEHWLSRVEIIPYRGVGNKSMLLGFRPDKLTVVGDKESISTNNVVIGIYHGTFNAEKNYDALLHPAVMREIHHQREASICVFPGQS